MLRRVLLGVGRPVEVVHPVHVAALFQVLTLRVEPVREARLAVRGPPVACRVVALQLQDRARRS